MIEQSAIAAPKGILYIAYGDRAKEQAGISMKTARKYARGLPIAVVTDRAFKGVEHNIIQPPADKGARTYKTQIYRLSPFELTLFLDADTEMLCGPDAGFKLLEYVDLVLGQDVNRIFAENHWKHLSPEEIAYTKQCLGGTGQFMYFNSGVIFFKRNERVSAMMDAWFQEWSRYGKQDQMALLRAIHNHPVRIAPMRRPWNIHHRSEAKFIYHKHHQARQEGAPQ